MLTTIVLTLLLTGSMLTTEPSVSTARALSMHTAGQCSLISSGIFQNYRFGGGNANADANPSQEPDPYGNSIGNAAAQDEDGNVDLPTRDYSAGASPYDSTTGISL